MYLLATRTIASLLAPCQQLFHEAKPRNEIVKIVEVMGDNKLAIVRLVSRWIFYYTEEDFFRAIYQKYII